MLSSGVWRKYYRGHVKWASVPPLDGISRTWGGPVWDVLQVMVLKLFCDDHVNILTLNREPGAMSHSTLFTHLRCERWDEIKKAGKYAFLRSHTDKVHVLLNQSSTSARDNTRQRSASPPSGWSNLICAAQHTRGHTVTSPDDFFHNITRSK